MLRLYRSNRAEFLAALLARQLLDEPPGPLETVDVMVNTWPTSRWLGEQLAQANGISSLIRFPFPGSRLRQLVARILDLPLDQEDPWRAGRLVWTLLDQLPDLLTQPEALPLRRWLDERESGTSTGLSRDRWQLARSIADAFDDYGLYRPDLLAHWRALPKARIDDWQPLLWRSIADVIPQQPFGLQVRRAVELLRDTDRPMDGLPQRLRLFGISALAPVQVELIQALSGWLDVEVYLLTPCRDLWQRCGNRRQQLGDAWNAPPDGSWLLEAPRLEACLGRMGAEFQQLLEGSGETQLGEVSGGDLFADAMAMASARGSTPTLLEQLQTQLVDSESAVPMVRDVQDRSLLFQAAPGPWREVQLVRDRILQWLAADPQLEPRDVLVMTPQIERYAPLLSSVFNDVDAIGIQLPWRLTDRTQHSSPGLSMAMLGLIELASGRVTASGLERLLSNPALQRQQGMTADDCAAITTVLQRTGFRWGLDADERGGEDTHSLRWCLDRWLLGLVLPANPGLAPGGAAPYQQDLDPDRLQVWWGLLDRLGSWVAELRRPTDCTGWVERLQRLLQGLFGDGGAWSSERESWLKALEDWRDRAGSCVLDLDAAVALEVLAEALSVDSGRFGHRSGSLTVSALEPMRAIPHKVIVLMGLDGRDFPRQSRRPGFHLLEQRRCLGDPSTSDQDRYVLLEALMSARCHLLISWCGRNERTGESMPPAAPIEQWLSLLHQQLPPEQCAGLLLSPPPNPLDRGNFNANEPLSCDRRQLDARRCLDQSRPQPLQGLALPLRWSPPDGPGGDLPLEDLQQWMTHPQKAWLRHRDLDVGEGIDAVDDLESLELDGLQRWQLLDQQLLEQLPESDPPDWGTRLLGQGLLPYGSGAQLEQDALLERWQALARQVALLGPVRLERRQLGDSCCSLLFAGGTQVVVQAGKPSARGVMQAWLQHLMLCASGDSPEGSALIGRSTNKAGAERLLHWHPLAVEEANQLLQDLRSMACHGLRECWPVPPSSGWQRVWHEQRKAGSGDVQFRRAWQDEGLTPVMRLCFGSETKADQLLDAPGFEQASQRLYGPLMKARRTGG